MRLPSRVLPTALGLLTCLFALRVAAQLLQAVSPTEWLPPFAAWQGSALPYPVLLSTQVLILTVMVWVMFRGWHGNRVLLDSWMKPVRVLAAIYFGTMAFRLLAGLTILAHVPWFAAALPATFHLVLATFLFLVPSVREVEKPAGAPDPAQTAQVTAYPGVLLATFALHAMLLTLGLGSEAAATIAVTAAAVAVTLFERQLPYRKTWHPPLRDVINDVAFMAVVQVVLPRLLGFAVVVAVAGGVSTSRLEPHGLWPHHWNLAAQALLMLLTADFLRYWLHRAAHNIPLLWRFHAVHHAPRQLYWLNVGRFHPLEKAVQFGFDSAPFILVGVSTHVLALYFVFYAVNGFFQHSNCNVRLGPLNYLVSGPELHRWHHSKKIAESNNNYGNNLIVWDWLFGTRFLPSDRQVGVLGLLDADYPADFLRQMRSPFASQRNPTT